jgi:hypothetical protein
MQLLCLPRLKDSRQPSYTDSDTEKATTEEKDGDHRERGPSGSLQTALTAPGVKNSASPEVIKDPNLVLKPCSKIVLRTDQIRWIGMEKKILKIRNTGR